MAEYPQTRRTFITTIALLFASGMLLVKYLTPRVKATRRELVSVAAADVPVNGALVFQNERVALLKNSGGYYAVSLICTHLGCTVTVTGDLLACPCHGSRFDRQGVPLQGPAQQPLHHFDLIENNGRITVYAS